MPSSQCHVSVESFSVGSDHSSYDSESECGSTEFSACGLEGLERRTEVRAGETNVLPMSVREIVNMMNSVSFNEYAPKDAPSNHRPWMPNTMKSDHGSLPAAMCEEKSTNPCATTHRDNDKECEETTHGERRVLTPTQVLTSILKDHGFTQST